MRITNSAVHFGPEPAQMMRAMQADCPEKLGNGINRALELLAAEIDATDKIIQGLHDRLGTVMYPPLPSNAAGSIGPAPSVPVSSLAEAIMSSVGNLRSIREMAENVLGRLDF